MISICPEAWGAKLRSSKHVLSHSTWLLCSAESESFYSVKAFCQADKELQPTSGQILSIDKRPPDTLVAPVND